MHPIVAAALIWTGQGYCVLLERVLGQNYEDPSSQGAAREQCQHQEIR